MPRAKATPKITDEEGELTAEALVQMLGEENASRGKPVAARDYVSTQCASLDYAIGRPGIPVGAVTNIYGPEASGKSTLAYHLGAETQNRGGFFVLYDSEGAYDYDRAKRIGLDYDEVVMLNPRTLEKVFDQVEEIIKKVSLQDPERLITIVIDSIAGAPAQAMLEGEYGDAHPAAQARAISSAMPRLVPLIATTKTSLVLVGQTRANLEFSPNPRANKETQIGEGAIRFYSHLRIRTQMAGEIGEKGEPSGIFTLAYTKKNKTAPPFRTARFEIDFWNGINRMAAALDVAQKIGQVQMRGGWFKYGDVTFRAADFDKVLENAPALQEAIKAAPMHWIEERENA